LFRDAEVLIGL